MTPMTKGHERTTLNEHQRVLVLAASAIDYGLTPDEQRLVRTHLAICGACSEAVRGFRDDATSLAAARHLGAPAAVRTAVIEVATRRSNHRSGARWPLLAAVLLVVLAAGSLVAGSVIDRLRIIGPAPSPPTAIDRATPGPIRTDDQAQRPTPTPGLAARWHDLGDITDAFGGRIVASVMAAPDGGLVAFGRERTSADTVVWVSDDGVTWGETRQVPDVFGNVVPTSGALGGPGMLVVGRTIGVDARQRAIWSSIDGRTWDGPSSGSSALLGTDADDLTITAGPAGAIAWTPGGDVWVSGDGETWKQGSIRVTGISDVAVDADRFVAVGQSGGEAFMITSTDGRTWAAPQRTTAPPGTQVGIERAGDGTEALWVGSRAWHRSADSWSAAPGVSVPSVPAPDRILGGASDLVAVGAPTSAGAYRAWTWAGSGDWVAARTDVEAGTGDPKVIAAAALPDAWFVLTQRGGRLHAWRVSP